MDSKKPYREVLLCTKVLGAVTVCLSLYRLFLFLSNAAADDEADAADNV